MEWHFLETEQTLKDGYWAMAKNKDTRFYRQGRLLSWFFILVYGGTLLSAMLTMKNSSIPPLVWVISLGMFVAGILFLMPRLVVFAQYSQLKISGLAANLLGPKRVRLADGVFRYDGGMADGSAGTWQCGVEALSYAEAAAYGVLVVLKDGRALFLPQTAFQDRQLLEACVQAINAAIAQACVSAPEAVPAAASAEEACVGFTPNGLGGGSLAFPLELAQVNALHKEFQLRLLRTPRYWTAQWIALPLLLATVLLVCSMIQRQNKEFLLFCLLVSVLFFFGSAFLRKRGVGLENTCGAQRYWFGSTGFSMETPAGHWNYLYEDFSLMETKNGFFLYKTARKAPFSMFFALTIPKTAFRTPEEQQLFRRLLRLKLDQEED